MLFPLPQTPYYKNDIRSGVKTSCRLHDISRACVSSTPGEEAKPGEEAEFEQKREDVHASKGLIVSTMSVVDINGFLPRDVNGFLPQLEGDYQV